MGEIRLLKTRRMFWTAIYTMRHPIDSFMRQWKWHNRPNVGDAVIDCRNQYHLVTDIDGDDLTLDDGSKASWMHCCDRPQGE